MSGSDVDAARARAGLRHMILPLGRGVFRIERADGTHVLAYAVADGPRTWLFIDGQTFIVEPPQHHRSGSADDVASLAAPMPATVTKIHVTIGQPVQPGDVLITLEAMKMELAIKSPRAAVVKSVGCTTGELVQPGVPLVALAEPENQQA